MTVCVPILLPHAQRLSHSEANLSGALVLDAEGSVECSVQTFGRHPAQLDPVRQIENDLHHLPDVLSGQRAAAVRGYELH